MNLLINKMNVLLDYGFGEFEPVLDCYRIQTDSTGGQLKVYFYDNEDNLIRAEIYKSYIFSYCDDTFYFRV